jgi:hypothetical protein
MQRLSCDAHRLATAAVKFRATSPVSKSTSRASDPGAYPALSAVMATIHPAMIPQDAAASTRPHPAIQDDSAKARNGGRRVDAAQLFGSQLSEELDEDERQ